MRRAAPRELEEQFTNLMREFLLTLRSLIDWYLERLDPPDPSPRSRTSRSTGQALAAASDVLKRGSRLPPASFLT